MPDILTKSFLSALTFALGLSNITIAMKADPELINQYGELLAGQSELSLTNSGINDVKATALAETLLSNKTVRRLNLNFNSIGEEGVAALARALSFNNILQELYLDNNNISFGDATKEYKRIGDYSRSVQYTLGGELEKNKQRAKMLKFDPQIIAFLVATSHPDSFWPRSIALTIARLKALRSANNLDLGQFVTIPGGIYEIGSAPTEVGHYKNEKLRRVILNPFSIMEAAMTQESYAMFRGRNPSKYKEAKYCPLSFSKIAGHAAKISVCADHPVEMVTWIEVNKFVELLNHQDAIYIYSLPTEAQLEVAFRGGTSTAYVTGRDDLTGLEDFVWYSDNSGGNSHPVKSTQKNTYGIRRSSVMEWAKDAYEKYYVDLSDLNHQSPTYGQYRAIRGSSFAANSRNSRSAYRSFMAQSSGASWLGFRLVRALK